MSEHRGEERALPNERVEANHQREVLPARQPRPALVLVLVLAVLSGAFGALSRLPPREVTIEQAARVTVPVSSGALVCPDAPALGDGSVTDVTAVSPLLDSIRTGDGQTGDGQTGDGQPLTVGSLDPDAPILASADARGPVATATLEAADSEPLAVRALGVLAPGLAASQLTTVPEGEATGIAGATCGSATTEAWFAGIGTEIGHRPRLALVNPELSTAEVDVVLYGPDGPLEAPALLDVVVPPRGDVSFELDAVAPDLEQLAVEVRVQVGRVTAGIRDARVDGLDSLGVDWVPASPRPASRVVVPGVSGGTGPRLLHVLAPGELDTRVRLRLLTPSGPITPSGLEEIEVTAGAVVEVDLAEVTGGEVSAVELTSEQPVVAGVRVVSDAVTPREMAYTSGTPVLDGPAVGTDVRAGDGWTARLVLTADDGGEGPDGVAASGRVRLSYVDAQTGAEIATDIVSVPAGATVDVELALDGVPDRFSLVVTPTGGALYAAVQQGRSDGPDAGFTLLPLTAPPLEIEVPRVRHDLSTGLRPDPGQGQAAGPPS